jgi:hypothetical protein
MTTLLKVFGVVVVLPAAEGEYLVTVIATPNHTS